jgi:putative tricarboxylic transport membrane protein
VSRFAVTAAVSIAIAIASIAAGACGAGPEGSRASSAGDAAYPAKDVTIIVPFGAGGGSDLLGRTIANVIRELNLLPVQILIENRPGGSGAVGYNYVAKQPGNPYMMATLSVSFFTTPLLGDSPVTYKDFTPIAAIAMSPYILTVRTDSSIRSVEDIKKVRRLTAGTTGIGSDAVLLADMLQKQSGVTIDAVPFDGEGDIMSALLGGHIDLMFGNTGEVLPQIEGGKMRPLAVTTAERLTSLPDVPTFTELGYTIVHSQLRGVVMPGGVPDSVVTRWEEVLRTVANSDQWKREYLERFKEEPRFVTGKEFGQAIEDTNKLYAQLLSGLVKKK